MLPSFLQWVCEGLGRRCMLNTLLHNSANGAAPLHPSASTAACNTSKKPTTHLSPLYRLKRKKE